MDPRPQLLARFRVPVQSGDTKELLVFLQAL